MKYLIILTIFLVSCHTFKIEGNKKGCWTEGHRITVCETALSYNSKTGEYRMMCEDGWTMHIKSEEITWK